MSNTLVSHVRKRVYGHRARWTQRHLMPYIRPADSVLDVGAGDCRLAALLQRKIGCKVTPVDVEDFNQTDLPLTLFDGEHLPFGDNTFDVVLLIFVLHHAKDARPVLDEARRVSRRSVIVFEDVTSSVWDRMMFRGFHRWLDWSEKISYPYREWQPPQWTELAQSLGLKQVSATPTDRQLGMFSCRHVIFEWAKPQSV
jgi:ubiquinone/menaquinone biosynthesis C-methylase UbiE